MTRKKVLNLYQAGVEAVMGSLQQLWRQVGTLKKRVSRLQKQVNQLKEQLAKNSRNSSKPPSSDSPYRSSPRSLRPKGQRKTGGQKGHPGSTLQQVEKTNHTVVHSVEQCKSCGASLTEAPASEVQKRQLFDLPPARMEVTEHQSEIKQCPCCNQINQAGFPSQLKAPAQYGSRIKAMIVYLRGYQLLPSKRTCELLRDLFGVNVSQGTLANILQECSQALQQPLEKIVRELQNSPLVHADESGGSVNGKLHWFHVAGNQKWTCYQIHSKRGWEAIEHIGILGNLKGRLIHDFWKPYFQYQGPHGLCNAHHLRELSFLFEEQKQSWAGEMKTCLLEMKDFVEKQTSIETPMAIETIQSFEARYQQIICQGYAENPMPQKSCDNNDRKKRGRPKLTRALNLLNRFRDYSQEVLAFFYDPRVPFDNNLAERDIRMLKVQQKISGTFRSKNGADAFCRIRSYISTIRKNGIHAIEALAHVFAATPSTLFPDTS